MKVFLTGATGYLGSALVRALHAAGHRAVGLARSRSKTLMPGGGAVDWVFADLREPLSYRQAAARCDAFVHLAAEYGPEAAALDLLAIDTLLGAAQAHDAPATFVYTSGLWVLGSTGTSEADEASSTDRPAEAVSWRPAHERRVLDAQGDRLVAAVVRPGMVFGRKGGLFDRFYSETQAGGTTSVVGDGRNRWSSVHVDDVAALYLAALEQGQTSIRALPPRERVFHAMSGAAERVGDIAQAANRAAGGRGVVKLQSVADARARYGAMADALAMDQVVRAPRTERVLGFRPRVGAFVAYAPRAFEEYSSA